MPKEKSYEQILSTLTALCSGAEHCEHEMREKMRRWGVDNSTQQKVIDYLVAEHYIDEHRYCRAFVREKIRFNHWGQRKIEQALYAKRIDRSVQTEVLSEVSDEEYVEVLSSLLRTKESSIKANSDYEKYQKLIRFALGRGFTFNIIKQCLDCECEVDDDIDYLIDNDD